MNVPSKYLRFIYSIVKYFYTTFFGFLFLLVPPPLVIHLTITHWNSAGVSALFSLFMETEAKKTKEAFVLKQSKQDMPTIVTKQWIQ